LFGIIAQFPLLNIFHTIYGPHTCHFVRFFFFNTQTHQIHKKKFFFKKKRKKELNPVKEEGKKKQKNTANGDQ